MTHSPHSLATHYFDLPTHRRMAYSQVGHADAPRVLLCLPGLLETRATFDPLLHATAHRHGVRVISVDYCGRGDSDPLHGDKGYTMSVYLHDVKAFLQQEVMHADLPLPRIELLGTSMGGILSMYLAHDKHNHIEGLFLNDIGLDLPWMSIYGLYDGMKKSAGALLPDDIAAELHVSLGALLAVQSPSHFDLPYRRDWKGMKFGHLLQHYSGALRLVHGADSGVCLSDQVREIRTQFPYARVLEVAGSKHPVAFTPAVCAFVLEGLAQPIQPATVAEKPPAPPEQLPELQTLPEATPSLSTDDEADGVWSWLKRKLGGRG
jgi:pimeloyl-ACP methyl ester carboxylesterase